MSKKKKKEETTLEMSRKKSVSEIIEFRIVTFVVKSSNGGDW